MEKESERISVHIVLTNVHPLRYKMIRRIVERTASTKDENRVLLQILTTILSSWWISLDSCMVILSQSLNRFLESKDRVGKGINAVIIASAGMRSQRDCMLTGRMDPFRVRKKERRGAMG